MRARARITPDAVACMGLAMLMACAQSDTLGAGSQSNWLVCERDEACPAGQRCACGYCTEPCDQSARCADLHPRAACRSNSDVEASCGGPTGGASDVCVVECESNGDCADTGVSMRCADGLCMVAEGIDTVAADAGQTSGEGWELLAFTRSGLTYGVAVANSEADVERMWQALPFDVPPPEIDFEEKVLIVLGHAVSGSCPGIQFLGLTIEPTRVYGTFALESSGTCTGDANPAAFLLAVERSALPERFTLTLTEEDICRGCDEDTLEVDLSSRDPNTTAWWARSSWGVVLGGDPPQSSHAFRLVYPDREQVLAVLRSDWSEGRRWIQGGQASSIPDRVEGFTADCVGGGECIEDPELLRPTGPACGVDVVIPPRQDGAIVIDFASDGSCEAALVLGSDGTEYQRPSIEPRP